MVRSVSLFLTASSFLALNAAADEAADQSTPSAQAAPRETVALPKAVPDPIEPMNRMFFGVNRVLMSGVIKPTARIYRFLVPKPVRTGINNFNRNITYPAACLTICCREMQRGARGDRPVLREYSGGRGRLCGRGRPMEDAEVGRGFWADVRQVGLEPNCYVMLPVLGPSTNAMPSAL